MSAAEGPASRRLVVLRHGRTAWNHEHRIQGQQDVGLDETGHEQAAAAAPYVAAYRPSQLWSSDLARAQQTAAYVAAETGLEPVLDARLREAMLGEREALTHAEYAALAPEEFERFRAGDWDVVPGGEGVAALRARMVQGLGAVLDSTGAGETSVVVSHGGAIKVALAELLGWPQEAALSLRALHNCSWAVLEQRLADGRIVLSAYGLTPISPTGSL